MGKWKIIRKIKAYFANYPKAESFLLEASEQISICKIALEQHKEGLPENYKQILRLRDSLWQDGIMAFNDEYNLYAAIFINNNDSEYSNSIKTVINDLEVLSKKLLRYDKLYPQKKFYYAFIDCNNLLKEMIEYYNAVWAVDSTIDEDADDIDDILY